MTKSPLRSSPRSPPPPPVLLQGGYGAVARYLLKNIRAQHPGGLSSSLGVHGSTVHVKRFSNGFSSTDPSGPPNGWPRSRWAVLGTVPTAFSRRASRPLPSPVSYRRPHLRRNRPRPPHARRTSTAAGALHRRRSPLPSNRRRARLAPARMLISPVPPRAGSRFPEAHRGSATLRRLASPAPLAAALRMLAGPAARPLRLGGAFLPRALVGRAPQRPRRACSLARPSLGARAQACGRSAGRGVSRDGLACGRARGALPAALSPRAPRGSWSPPSPGRRPASVMSWTRLGPLVSLL